jgi:hypothetical protein
MESPPIPLTAKQARELRRLQAKIAFREEEIQRRQSEIVELRELARTLGSEQGLSRGLQ